MNQSKNKKRFVELLAGLNREGKEELLEFLEKKTDFYTAPASTRFHLSCEGGLLQHSLNVYDCMLLKKQSPIWEPLLRNISAESIAVVSLLHDVCKVNSYVKEPRNRKTYDSQKVAAAPRGSVKRDEQGEFIWETVMENHYEDSLPLGHGEKSVFLIMKHMKLTEEELMAIRWHMGFSDEKATNTYIGKAMEMYPLVLALYEADMEASKLLEDCLENKTLAANVAEKVSSCVVEIEIEELPF